MLSDQIMMDIESKYGKIVEDGYTENWLQIENPQIFYSSKMNTCIYFSEVIQKMDSEDIDARYFLKIEDFFKKETIIEVVCDSKTSDKTSFPWNPQYTSKDSQEFLECTKPFNDKVEELKLE